jgi:hypothetical protein
MAKNSKKSKEETSPGNGSSAPENAATSAPAMAKSIESSKPAARPKSAGKRAGKAPGSRQPRAATSAPKTSKAGPVAISDEDIRIRAYFISEQRIRNGLPGDSHHDWLEAHRQLREEAGQGA